MKKTIIVFAASILLYYIITPRTISLKGYYYLSKEERQNVINTLYKGCRIDDGVFSLIVTYDEILNDKNASHCWSNYYKKCFYNKEHNLTLSLPIKCPTY